MDYIHQLYYGSIVGVPFRIDDGLYQLAPWINWIADGWMGQMDGIDCMVRGWGVFTGVSRRRIRIASIGS